MDLLEIKQHLKRGDYKIIAKLADVTPKTVQRTLNGEFNSPLVVRCAQALVDKRKEFIHQQINGLNAIN